MKYSFVILLISFAILACRAQDDEENPIKAGMKHIKDMINNSKLNRSDFTKDVKKIIEAVTGNQNTDEKGKNQIIDNVQDFFDKIKDSVPQDMLEGAKKLLDSVKRNSRGRRTTEASDAD